MRRWLPFPLLSVALLAMWLLLFQSVSIGNVLLGAAIAVVAPWSVVPLLTPRDRRIRGAWAMITLACVVASDVLRSNLAVGRLIINPRLRGRRSGLVDIPLTLRDPYALAILAIIVTSTPGTLWVSFDPATGVLTLHVLDLVDEAGWIAIIKGRYESRLREIFE
jgi:multicomponent K+:H+ antiporter subunit E